jgi:hypothetical protein
VTSPDDQLDGIFSQIAAQDQVDPAIFDQTLEAAFEHTGPGFEDLIPETESTFPDDPDDPSDDLFVGDDTDDFGSDDPDTEPSEHSDPLPADDYTPGDDLLT